MTDSDPLELARQGNPDAIATLFNRQLNDKGVVVKAIREGDCLQLLLESAKILNQEVAIAGMQKRLMQLNPAGIAIVRLQFLQEGALAPAWRYEFRLLPETAPPSPNPEPEPVADPQTIPEAESVEAPQPRTTTDTTPSNPKLTVRIGVSELVLLGFGFFLFLIFCRFLHFNFFAGIFLAFIPATLAYNRGYSFWTWYAYGLILYFPATLHTSFLKRFNPYGIVAFFLGGALFNNFADSIGTLLMIPNLIFGLIPAIIAVSKKRNFINWYVYGIFGFLVALFHSTLLKVNILKTLDDRNLEKVSFAGKDLIGANFQGSNLNQADFRKAKLIGANFQNSQLERANFSGAKLWGTHFDRANLRAANFSQTSNRWQQISRTKSDAFLPWWIPVGAALFVIQLLLWGLFFGSPLGLLVSRPLDISWQAWIARPPFLLSCYTGAITALLVAITLALGRRRSFAIALLAVLSILPLVTTARSLKSLSPPPSLELFALSSFASLLLIAATVLAARSLRRNHWRNYCTWVGMTCALSFWAMLLLWSNSVPTTAPQEIAHFIAALVPRWWFDNFTLRGIWLIATLAAWGALVGNLIGFLTHWRITSFRDADLTEATFARCNLSHPDFTGANLSQVNWQEAKLENRTRSV